MSITGGVIRPVGGMQKLSMPNMKAMPEICPAGSRKPLEVPSGVELSVPVI